MASLPSIRDAGKLTKLVLADMRDISDDVRRDLGDKFCNVRLFHKKQDDDKKEKDDEKEEAQAGLSNRDKNKYETWRRKKNKNREWMEKGSIFVLTAVVHIQASTNRQSPTSRTALRPQSRWPPPAQRVPALGPQSQPAQRAPALRPLSQPAQRAPVLRPQSRWPLPAQRVPAGTLGALALAAKNVVGSK